MKPGKLIIILMFFVNSQVLLAEITSNIPATNEQYLIIGKIKERKTITGERRPSEVISSNKYGGTVRVYLPTSFEQIILSDYKMYKIEDRLIERIFFSTNVFAANTVLIVKYMADTRPDLKPCVVLAEPYSLPDDVVQKNNLQGAKILQVKGIFKNSRTIDDILKEYGINPPAWAEISNATNVQEQVPLRNIEGQKNK